MSAALEPRLALPTLEALQQAVVACGRCPRLVAWREQVGREKRAAFRDEAYWARPVPGWGDERARLLIVGLAPAAHGGNRTGRIFTGDRSGDWLFRALYRAGFANQPESVHRGDGLAVHDAYIAAAVRCAPPGNLPTPEEAAACAPFLRREFELLGEVRVVVVLGAFAYRSLARVVGLGRLPAFGHGREVALGGGRTLLCSYHPSQQNTFTGKLTEPMLDGIFSRARELLAGA